MRRGTGRVVIIRTQVDISETAVADVLDPAQRAGGFEQAESE